MRTEIVSKDVLDARKVMQNIDSDPSESITELTRIMVENIQRVQLNDMHIDTASNICSQLKCATNNIFLKWNIKQVERGKKTLK